MNQIQPHNPHSAPYSAPTEMSVTPHDLVHIAWRRLWLIALIIAVSILTAAVISRHTPKRWQANAQVLLVQRSPMMVASTQAAASAPVIESIETQITLLQSRELAQEAAKKIGVSADTLLASSAITPRKDGDNVIDLTVEADSRQHAIERANALCQTFVEYKKTLAQRNSQEDLSQLEVQAAQAKKQVADADAKLLVFQQTHHLGGIGVLDPQAQKTAALNAILAQNTVIAGLQNDNATAQATAAALSSELQRGKEAIAKTHTVRDDSEVTKLQESLGDLKQKRYETSQRYLTKAGGPGQLLLAQLDGQIATTQANLNQAIQTLESQPSLQAQGALQQASDAAQSAASSARVKLAAAIAQRDELNRQTVDLPKVSQDAQNLIDNAAQAHNLYNAASTAVQSAQLDKDVASGNVQIVQAAFAPDAPFSPEPKRDLMVGFGVGLLLSLLAVLLLEQMDSSVRTAADVRRLVDGPVVAVLPQMTRMEKSQFADGSRPPHLIETYNAARANLGLAMRQRTGVNLDDHQIILVTSALPGEG
ncbi:MAG: GumC family protein, partial [Janthinobacterium lividum]